MSGLILICFFSTNIETTFININLFKLNYSFGWLIQNLHEINSNIIFLLIYSHIFKNIYYSANSYENRWSWFSGFILYLLTIIICFLGYVLPWGQMSFWAATVITNLLSILPYGSKLILVVWGNLTVGQNTLTKFMVLHYLLPFILLIVVIIHLNFVHYNITNKFSYITIANSNNYFNLSYFIIKDLNFIIIILFIIIYIFSYMPDLFSNYINKNPANYMQTPKHIIPEWYFLWLYAILKLIPDKSLGIITIACVLVIILLKPLYSYKIQHNSFLLILIIFLILEDIGFCPVTIALYFILKLLLFFIISFLIMKIVYQFSIDYRIFE